MPSLIWLSVPARGGQHCIAWLTNLQDSSHEYGAAHEQEDDQAGQPLFSDAQEARLLSWSRALWLQLQAVDMRDGQDRGRYEPRQAHDGTHRQHHSDHQQVQVVPTALLQRGGQTGACTADLQCAAGSNSADAGSYSSCMIWMFRLFSYQQFVLFTVDDDGCYLLVHKDEDGAEKSRNRCGQDRPPWVAPYWIDQPTSVISGGLQDPIEGEWGHESTLTAFSSISRSALLQSFPLYLEFARHLQLLGGHSNDIIEQNHDSNGEEHCKVTDHGPHLGTGDQ